MTFYKPRLEMLSDKEKGYLFGLFEGDGYSIYDRKRKHYIVDFYLNARKDEDIKKFLLKILYKIGLNPYVFEQEGKNCNRIRIRSKLFKEFIENQNYKNLNKDSKMGFLSGFIDAEGYVVPKKSTLGIVNTNKQLMGMCVNILNEANIYCSIRQRVRSKKDKLKSYLILISMKFKNTKHISQKVWRLGSCSAGRI
ncbi:MAG: hypothetical protein CMH63_03580 [Nanoarchaeota archaeon]|nr:hypothetical protein [Nanoarchaeota archaeon]|tara:strand:+ start:15622 stop:16206 length:585 start_codon:yes stop_codon:yes gene_type:complete